MSRWSARINHDIQKFDGLFRVVLKTNQSGASFDDNIQTAMRLYKEASWNSAKAEFEFRPSWEILREHPKWGGSVNTANGNAPKRRKLNDEGESSETIGGSSGSGCVRPRGVKSAIEVEKDRNEFQKRMNLEERKIVALEKKTCALKDLNQLQAVNLFSRAAGAGDEEIQQYMSLMRMKMKLQLDEGVKRIMVHYIMYINQ